MVTDDYEWIMNLGLCVAGVYVAYKVVSGLAKKGKEEFVENQERNAWEIIDTPEGKKRVNKITGESQRIK